MWAVIRSRTSFSSSRRAALALVLASFIGGICHATEPPRLVLQITVDQLRGDMLARHHDRFGADGFRRLVDHGTYFINTHYGTGNTFTASGHAVLALLSIKPPSGNVAAVLPELLEARK